MTKRSYLLLFFISLFFVVGIASTQSTPGYMDADYYYATGIQLAEGHGFTEPFLWNYLDNPAGLPHPSHAYWMPLSSLLAALGMRLARGFGFASAQLAFILLAALIPPMTAALAFSLTSRRDLALISALLAIFSGYYAPFLTTTDTFSLYILLGGSFFLALKIRRIWLRAIILGVIAALMHLSRTDGAIWLIFAMLSFLLPTPNAQSLIQNLKFLILLFFAYFSITLPWFLRNYAIFGSSLAPGSDQMLWLTSYNQIFAYPAGNLSLQTWLASGWDAIIAVRFWALKLNLGTMLGVQSEIILLPFIIIGAWKLRKDQVVSLGIFAWLTTLFVMTLIFPFAGARGGFFHSGAALQMLWWSLAPLGLDRVLAWMVARRGWRAESSRVFQGGLVAASLLLTGAILWMRVLSPSEREQAQNRGVPRYLSIEKIIEADSDLPVIVANPPGYFLASHRPALALPDGDIQTVFAIAERYGARYLILEEGAVTEGLMPIFDAPAAQKGLIFLEEIEGAKIFAIE